MAVLIDGDGAKFSTELLRAQEPGGREAARRLNQAVRNYLKEIDPEHGTDVTTVVVSVWANLKFLSRALYVDGAISNTNHMMEFAEGFSRSRAEFDFVNVGRGKENADNKLRKMLDFYYNNIQCKKIFFAGCHDTGYIHDLEEKRGTDEARRRIVLLETTTAEAQFRELEFPMTRFDTIFRREPLNNETKQNRALSYNSVSPTEKVNAVALPSSSNDSSSETNLHQKPRVESDEKHKGVEQPLSMVQRSKTGGVSISHASAGNGKDHENIDISNARNAKPRCILYNEAQHRLDGPNTRSWSSTALHSYDEKLERIRPRAFCNDFYLIGRCLRRGNCFKEHEEMLTSEETAIHRYRARTGPCGAGPFCRNYDCYSSHHCPAGQSCCKGSECLFSQAKSHFGDLHFQKPADQKPVLRWIEGEQFPRKIL